LSFPKRTTTGLGKAPITPPPSSTPVRTVIPEPAAPVNVPPIVVVEVQSEVLPTTEVNPPKAKQTKARNTNNAPQLTGGLAVNSASSKPKFTLPKFGKMPWTRYFAGLGLVIGAGGVVVTAAYNVNPTFRFNTLLTARDSLGYYDPACAQYKTGTTLVLRRQTSPLSGATPSQKTQLQICQSGIPNGTSNAPYLMTYENGKLGIPTGVSFKIQASRNFVARNQSDVLEIEGEKAEIAKQISSQKDPAKLKELQNKLVELEKRRDNLALAISPWLEFGALVSKSDGSKLLITDLSKTTKADIAGPGVLKGLLIPLDTTGDLPDVRLWERSPDNQLIIGYRQGKSILGKVDPIAAFAARSDNPLDGATLTIEDLNGDNAPAPVSAQPQAPASPAAAPVK
jgi:hypothetical protein